MTTERPKPAWPPPNVRKVFFRPEMTDEEIDAALDKLYEGTEFEGKPPTKRVSRRVAMWSGYPHGQYLTMYERDDGMAVLAEDLFDERTTPDWESERYIRVWPEHAAEIDLWALVEYLTGKPDTIAVFRAWLEARNIPFETTCV